MEGLSVFGGSCVVEVRDRSGAVRRSPSGLLGVVRWAPSSCTDSIGFTDSWVAFAFMMSSDGLKRHGVCSGVVGWGSKMLHRRVVFCVVALIAGWSAWSQCRPTTGCASAVFAEVDRAMIDLMCENDIPGATLAVAYNGVVVYERGCGWSDRERLEAADGGGCASADRVRHV